MATFGGYSFQVLIMVMVIGLFCMTKILAQDSEIAPTSQLETGTGCAMPVSVVIMFCSMFASFMVFMMQ
ncbi:unnamed protein product [Lathyrus sativus]|nr:unnamed protein product [Lathyrus sativus]